jgi:hypothetical protein
VPFRPGGDETGARLHPNREGHGIVAADPNHNGGKGSLEYLVKDPATAKRFAALVDATGQWRKRDDVWITYLDRKGPLTVGYGAKSEMIGPELGFGWVMGDALHEPILLVKCAWGDKSLAIDFRPPSDGVGSSTYSDSQRGVEGRPLADGSAVGGCGNARGLGELEGRAPRAWLRTRRTVLGFDDPRPRSKDILPPYSSQALPHGVQSPGA